MNNEISFYLNFYYWLREGHLYPFEVWDGAICLYNTLNEWGNILYNSYSDTSILYTESTDEHRHYIEISPLNYYHIEGNYELIDVIVDQSYLFNDWSLWRGTTISGCSRPPLYVPTRWHHLGSLKQIPTVKELVIYSYPQSYNLYGWELPFKINTPIEDLTIKYYGRRKDRYDINYLPARTLVHHDFVVGQYVTTTFHWLENSWYKDCTLKQTIVPIFNLFWYERFGSVEIIWKSIDTWFYEFNYPYFRDGFGLRRTFAHRDLSNIIEPVRWWDHLWLHYKSVEQLEEHVWNTEDWKMWHFTTFTTLNVAEDMEFVKRAADWAKSDWNKF